MALPAGNLGVFQAMRPVGHLSKVGGVVAATSSATGQVRMLQPGDPVYSDDVVSPKSGATGVVVMNSGQEIVVLGESDFNFNVGNDAVSFLGDLGAVSYLLNISLFNESASAGVAIGAGSAQSVFDISGIEGNPAFSNASGLSLNIPGESSFGAGSEALTLGRGAANDDVVGNESSSVRDAISARETRDIEAQVATTESRVDSSSESSAPPSEAPAVDLNASSGGVDFATTFIAENNTAILIQDADAALTDVDSANLTSLTVTITNLQDGAFEALDADISGTLIAKSYDSTTGVLTLSGSDTIENYQQVLRTVTYNNTSETPDTTARSITFVANDGAGGSSAATTTLTMLTSDDNLFGTPTITGTSGDDNITGTGGKDIIAGLAGDDTVNAGDKADKIAGGDGDDTLSGGKQADIIHGQFGADTIDGGRGADTIVGGFGDDVLTGGRGKDTFIYTSLLTDGDDTITDFGRGNDKTQLGDALTAAGKTDSDVVLTQSGGDVVLTVNGFSSFSITYTGRLVADFETPGTQGFGIITLA